MTVPALLFGAAGTGVHVDLERFAETRCLIQGVSGSGKSTLIRSLLEQTHGKVPHLVIDSEGDFVTLREKFDYVLVGRGGDVPISVKTAKVTVRRLAELNVSAIFDLSELRFPERREWVRIACEELVHLPRTMWQTRLVVLDEAHIYCPERGSGESVSTSAVIDVVTLGRKRGLVPICATQRLSKLHKDAAGELLNKLIGYTDDVDLQRAGDQLGMTKEQRNQLKLLDTHTFYAYGPAISRAPVLVRTQMPTTKPPARGQDRPASPPARTAVQKVLAQLADLPKQAEEEAKSIEDLRRQNGELNRRIRQLERGAPAAAPKEVLVVDQAAIAKAVRNDRAVRDKKFRPVLQQLQRLAQPLGSYPGIVGELASILNEPLSIPSNPDQVIAGGRQPGRLRAPTSGAVSGKDLNVGGSHRTAPEPRRSPAGDIDDLSGAKKKIINTIALLNALGIDKPSIIQVALFNGVSHTTGSYLQNLRELASENLIERDKGTVTLCPETPFDEPDVSLDVVEFWYNKLPGAQSKLLKLIVDTHPGQLTIEELAERAGVSHTTGSYLQNIREMATLGIVERGKGWVQASELLLLDGR